MKREVARTFLAAVAEAAGTRGDSTEEALDRLGVGGLFRRLFPDDLAAPRPEAKAMRHLWDAALMETAAGASDALRRAGIVHAFWKGAAMRRDHYAPGDVDMTDIDAFVAFDSAKAAAEALISVGGLPVDEGAWHPEPTSPRVFRFPGPDGADALAVDLDLHAAVYPPRRLLPWGGGPLPAGVWEEVDASAPFPVFRPGHHAALLVYHLIRHDFLHLRSLVDFMTLAPALEETPEERAFVQLARALGVARAGRALSRAVRRPGLTAQRGWPGREERSTLAGFLRGGSGPVVARVLAASQRDHEAVSLARARTRLAWLDRPLEAGGVLRDVMLPPKTYLAWRWPGGGGLERRVHHFLRLAARFRGD